MKTSNRLQTITHENETLAIIIRNDYVEDGINFFTPDDFSQQLAYMRRSEGYTIPPHVHNEVPREVKYTQEVLFVKSGRVRVDFYDGQKSYLHSDILHPGDVILLAYGGHGFFMIEESEIIEVKQGPYAGEEDKVRFDPVDDNKVKLPNDGIE